MLGAEEALSQSVPLDQVSESQESTYEHRHDVIVIETDSNSDEEGGTEEAGQVRFWQENYRIPLMLVIFYQDFVFLELVCFKTSDL